MPAIYPVSASRVSDQLLTRRLLSQFAYDQRQLLTLQDQVSTGYRFNLPSEDAPAANRAITLQRILEQRAQTQVNLNTTQSYVEATEGELSGLTTLLINIRGDALAATDTTASDEQRLALAQQVRNAVDQFVTAGNRQFRGRHLFAGSRTTEAPFEARGAHVIYHGNTADLTSVIDVDYLFDANLSGDEVFGAISPQVRGTADLNPVLTLDTRLSDLRGGAGITKGSLVISDSFATTTVDIASAETIGDVARLIEAAAPGGRQLTARLTSNGLELDLSDAGGGNLTVREIPGGTTADELGILNTVGTGIGPLVGKDLDPQLTATTSLRDILGTRASAVVPVIGPNNDLVIKAVDNGAQYEGVEVQVVNSGTVAGNSATATFDQANNVLRIDINPSVTTATAVITAVNATGLFTAELDTHLEAPNDGSGVFSLTAAGTLAGGSGINLDQTAGIQIVNGGQTHTITFEDAETVEDLLNKINGSSADALATISADGSGIDVRSRLSGASFQIGENGGTTATELGLRSFTRESLLGDLNYGRGVDITGGNDALVNEPNFIAASSPHIDFTIERKDGTTLDIDIRAAHTVGEVIDLINLAAGETIAGLTAFGNGIEIVDSSVGPGDLTISRRQSFAAWDLGLIPRGQDSASDPNRIVGVDANPLETKGVFNSLLRLGQALETSDLSAISRAVEMLDDDFQRLSFARSDLGARTRALQSFGERLENEDVQLRATLSADLDVDMVQAISDLQTRQANMEATLRLVGQLSQLTLLNFL